MFRQTNEFIRRAHDCACRHGFHDVELSVEHCMMLVITEVGEMVEADRCGRSSDSVAFKKFILDSSAEDGGYFWRDCFLAHVKDTVEDEMADVMIRLYDTCGAFGITFTDDTLGISMEEDYAGVANRSFTEKAFMLCGMLCCVNSGDYSLEVVIGSALNFVECWAKDMGIDLRWHVESKMLFNETRSSRHGKSY